MDCGVLHEVLGLLIGTQIKQLWILSAIGLMFRTVFLLNGLSYIVFHNVGLAGFNSRAESVFSFNLPLLSIFSSFCGLFVWGWGIRTDMVCLLIPSHHRTANFLKLIIIWFKTHSQITIDFKRESDDQNFEPTIHLPVIFAYKK